MEVMTVMKEQSNRVSLSRSSSSICKDISPSSSQFFEVMYIGKIKVSHRKVPDTFIDDALDKFRNFERLRKEREESSALLLSSPLLVSTENVSIEADSSREFGSSEAIKADSVLDSDKLPNHGMVRKRSGSLGSVLMKRSDSVNSAPGGDLNRTMVFHVGRSDLRLVSLDRKQVLLYKHLKDISCALQGTKHATHFAFICKESGLETCTYIGYVFNCQSQSVAEDIVSAVLQAVSNEKKNGSSVVSCDHCPMVWYHKLCSEIEGLSEKAQETAILKKLDLLPEEEQSIVRIKLEGASVEGNPKQQTELLMMLLRAHCESKQARHIHDTPHTRHEFLTQYLSGGAIFMKAKRSLTSSFDQLLKRKGSRDDLGPFLSAPPNSSLAKDLKEHIIAADKNDSSQPSSDAGSDSEEPQSPGSMMNIFRKVGSPISNFMEKNEGKETPHSWRQAIFHNVVTPSKIPPRHQQLKRDKDFYRSLWKKAINQQILLIRMERENARLTARQEEANAKRVKLDYDEISQSHSMELWEEIISGDKSITPEVFKTIFQQGIPKSKRGEAWLFLAEKYESEHGAFDPTSFPNYNTPYLQLVQQLTSHQHAILIDLGRTLPTHPYFSSPLGPGQLSLFNLLKAYSLLDPEVGYCQGLSFIAAVFLLHMSEEQAFFLLKHVMIRRGLRARYLPDMAALQVALYQLSRLVHDKHPELYAHLDALDISPTLYAPPWLLTFFASTFPLGFVTRIFDMIFLDSPEIMFKVVVALLGQHKKELLKCDSFEAVMEHLKSNVPLMCHGSLELITSSVVAWDISKELIEFSVEYHILQEEMATPRPEHKRIKQLEIENEHLKKQNKATEQKLQIAMSNITRLESTRSAHMSQINKLESQVKSLEATMLKLGEFISDLGYNNQVEIPTDVLRMVTQLSISENRKQGVREAMVRRLSGVDKASLLSRPTEQSRSKSPRREDRPLKSTKSAFELRPKATHPLDSQTIPTFFEGTTPMKSLRPYTKRNTLSELRIVESIDDDDFTTHPKESIYPRGKLFSEETQLLIKSQAPPNAKAVPT